MTQLDLFGEPIKNSTATETPLVSMPPKIVLRDYQQASVDAVFKEFESVTSTLVCLPTGCGKSVVFSAVMKRADEEGIGNDVKGSDH